jgi:hypothetical protein
VTLPPRFRDLGDDELAQRLLSAGRADHAPASARDRTLAVVAAAPLAGATLVGTKSVSAAVGSSSTLLGVKWVAVGLVASLAGLTVLEHSRQPPETSSQARRAPPRPSPASAALRESAPVARSIASAPPPATAATSAPPKTARSSPSALPRSAAAPSADASSAPGAGNEATQLTREIEALKLVRTALESGASPRARALLTEYHAEFSSPVLAIEARALEVELAFALREARAPDLARDFLARHGESPLAERVRALSSKSRTP